MAKRRRSWQKRRRSGSGTALKIVAVVVTLALVIGLGAVFGPRLIHHCDNCGRLFFGTGYYANVVTNTIGAFSGEEEKILCNDCAMREHALAIAAGKSLREFKRPLFGEKESAE